MFSIFLTAVAVIVALTFYFFKRHSTDKHKLARHPDMKGPEALEQEVAYRAKLNTRLKKYLIAGVIGVALVNLVMSSTATVRPSTIAIQTVFGKIQDETLEPGIHIIRPWNKLHEINVGLDVAAATNAEGGSKDLQIVHTSITLNYRVDPSKVLELYKLNPSLKYEDAFVVPAMYETFKAITSRYTAEELITKRQEVSSNIREALVQKVAKYYLIVQDINIVNFAFSKSFNDSVEAKVKAQQDAERSGNETQRVRNESEQQIIQAKAQAETIKIQAEVIQAQGGKEFIQLEAIKKWDGKLPVYMTGGTPTPFINVK